MHRSQKIGTIPDSRRFREAYIRAVFPFLGRKYRVDSYGEKTIDLAEAEPYFRTDPSFYMYEDPKEFYKGEMFGDTAAIYYGKMDIITRFAGYNLVDERSDIRTFHEASDMLPESNRHAFWITVAQDELAHNGLSALEHILRVGAMFVIPADRFDANTLSKAGRADRLPICYYYETYAGGIGVAKNLYADWERALKKGVEVARNCPCRVGCQECIEPPKFYGDTKINKHLGIELAARILDAASNGPTMQIKDGRWIPVQKGYREITTTSMITAVQLDDPAEALIARGESDLVELKSTLRINLHTGKRDSAMEDSVLKTMAGFFNAEGGTLLIGVADDGSVLGIESDHFSSEDEMRRHLTEILKRRMPAATLVPQLLDVAFEDCAGKRVLRVGCSRSAIPILVKDGTDEIFYLRMGARTEKLPMSEAMKYIGLRFPESS